MNTEAPNALHALTRNEDGTYTCNMYEFDPTTRERTQVGQSELYRVATEADREAHARGELQGRTRTVYNPDDFTMFLLIRVDETQTTSLSKP